MKKLYETINRGSAVNYIPRSTSKNDSISKFSSDIVSNKDRDMPKYEEIFNVDYLSLKKEKTYVKKKKS